ncbi:ParB/RepB/Spo0J family partition protein [candidate division WOR-3 bacterium]|uniref:ParB/RepB/Spo0J family partition protein n=1 Tax=candidate division WOR-3 bacterium TaxID=2052148 RepID=A0A937XG76_UNCW3|nr:ParB/RepB/Spo0J family partition protein [candidate division WOR-3 bacterium]
MRKALGKGIRAIIPEETRAAMAAEARPIRIDEIRPNPFQPRTKTEENLDELVASIKTHGVLQPIMVRRRRDGYEVVMGERRLRASKLAGLEQVPAVIRSVDELEMLEFALIENLQRQNLNPIDEAMGYKRLNDEFKQTHEVIAQRVGKDRSTVANALRLLDLPFKVRDCLAAGLITAGHGRALLMSKNRRLQVEVCERIVKEGLSVRSVEKLCGEPRPKEPHMPKPEKDIHLREVEEGLAGYLGTRVVINPGKAGAGDIVVRYFSAEDLERVVEKMKRH